MNRQWRPSFARRLFGSASWWRRSRQRRQLRPNSIGSQRVVESSYPGRLVPQRYRRCLRVLILDLAFTPEATLDRPPPFPSHLGDGNAKRWRLRGSTLRMRRSRAWLESRGLSCSPPSTGTKSRWSRESSRHCVAAVATAVRGPPSRRAISPKTSFAPTSLSTTSLPPFAGTLILTTPETTARSPSPGSPLANIVAPTG